MVGFAKNRNESKELKKYFDKFSKLILLLQVYFIILHIILKIRMRKTA